MLGFFEALLSVQSVDWLLCERIDRDYGRIVAGGKLPTYLAQSRKIHGSCVGQQNIIVSIFH